MKHAFFIFSIISLFNPSIAHADFASDFAKGFLDVKAKQQEEEAPLRTQKSAYENFYKDILAKYQTHYNATRQAEDSRMVQAIAAYNDIDLPKCNPHTISRKNAVQFEQCSGRAITKRLQAVNYPYMDMVSNYHNKNKKIAKAYANGKISQDEYNEKRIQNYRDWEIGATAIREQVDASMQADMAQMAHLNAMEWSTDFASEYHARERRERATDDLNNRIKAAENKAEQASRDAASAQQRAQQAEWDAQRAENQALRYQNNR